MMYDILDGEVVCLNQIDGTVDYKKYKEYISEAVCFEYSRTSSLEYFYNDTIINYACIYVDTKIDKLDLRNMTGLKILRLLYGGSITNLILPDSLCELRCDEIDVDEITYIETSATKDHIIDSKKDTRINITNNMINIQTTNASSIVNPENIEYLHITNGGDLSNYNNIKILSIDNTIPTNIPLTIKKLHMEKIIGIYDLDFIENSEIDTLRIHKLNDLHDISSLYSCKNLSYLKVKKTDVAFKDIKKIIRYHKISN